MESALCPVRSTIADYLRTESTAKERREFRDGWIVARQGGSPRHSLIIANVIGELGNRLDGKPCGVYDSNLRVRILRTANYTYPDVSVVCGPMQFDPEDVTHTTATNPTLIVEVLSPSSEADDRGDKFQRYLTLESLKQYVLVSQDQPRVETFCRLEDGTWRFAYTTELAATIMLDSIKTEVEIAEIYAGVQFPAPADTAKPG